MIQLPVSGMPARFRPMTGVQECELWTARGDTGPATIARLLASLCESTIEDWSLLPITDADFALLAGRQQWVGDRIETTVRCPFDDCAANADVDFSISDFLEYRRPRLPKGVASVSNGYEWQSVTFRAPTLADEEAARASSTPVKTLSDRCIDSTDAKVIRRAEAFLELIAPSLVSELSLTCPGCGRDHSATFDPRAFVLKELADQAQFLWDDVHLLASTYHWGKVEILSLDRAIRVQLAERIRDDRTAGV